MTPRKRKSPAQTVARPVIAVVGLAIVAMFVLSYVTTYRADKGSDAEATTETTATAEATGSAEATATEAAADGAEEEAAPAASKGTVIVLIDGLNFRTGPSKSGDLIRGLDEGEKLTYVGTEDGWYKVTTADGETGYVSASTQYTKLEQ
jgi:uncharacterized protein YgiM (DUF1202 family)